MLVVDVDGFDRPGWSAEHRAAARRGLRAVLSAALADVGTEFGDCVRYDRGEGLAVVLPACVRRHVLVERFLDALDVGVRKHNTEVDPVVALRLRVVLHLARHDADVERAVELAEALAEHRAVTESPGPVVVACSEQFADDGPPTAGGPYRRVPVDRDETCFAWLRQPAEVLRAEAGREQAADEAHRTAAEHRSILVVDIEGFGRADRTGEHRRVMRDGLYTALADAFADARADWDSCTREDRGDGVMVLVPPEIPKELLVDQLLDRLAAAIRRYNSTHSPGAQIRLRVALHAGEVRRDAHGHDGNALNLAFRLLEAPALKELLARTTGVIVLAVSEWYFDEVVRNYPAVDAASFRRVPVSVKETSTIAWLRAGGVRSGPPATAADRGATPAVWGGVPSRNVNFTGREELLDALHAGIGSHAGADVRPTALHGMGGIGKTQIAVEHVHRHAADHDLVWWIPAHRPAQVRSSFVELAERLSLPGAGSAETAVPAVLEALRTGQPYGRWLLVFDNADRPGDVRPFFPAGGGRVLVTSRNPQWSTVALGVEVDLFTREESTQLLRRRAGGLSEDDADRIADVLGDLPLALEQAAAWRVETGMPAREYLELFRRKQMDLLAAGAPVDYPMPVAAAWNVSLDRLRARSPEAFELLRVCSFFGPEPIHRGLLSSARLRSPVADSEDMTDPILLGKAVRDISRFGLARLDHRADTVQFHRLVQLVVREEMTEREREARRHVAHLVLADSAPHDPADVRDWPRCAELLPHVCASRAIDSDDPLVRRLVLVQVVFLRLRGDFTGCRALAEEVHQSWSRRLGEEHPDALAAAKQLGIALRNEGDSTRSRAVNSHALDVARRVYGPHDGRTLSMAGVLAADLRATGDFAAALRIDADVAGRLRDLLGEDDAEALSAAHNHAVSLRLCGRYTAARDVDRDTWLRKARVLGEHHRWTLLTLNSLALDLRQCGEYAQAAELQESTLARYRDLLGDDHPDTTQAIRTFAAVLRRAGDHDSARKLSEEALTRLRELHGDEHPATTAAAANLAVDLRLAGDLVESIELGRVVWHRYRRNLGEGHPWSLATRTNLAVSHRLRGDVAVARHLDEGALRGMIAVLGPQHPFTLACRVNLASDLAGCGDVGAALEVGEDAVAGLRVALGPDHPVTLSAEANTALDLRALGRVPDAEAVHADVLARLRVALGDLHPAIGAVARQTRADCDVEPVST
ncbi:FxSxx-COOH system tetratricopeptide repeat protein [Umezawaea beigongshangensis]|uniref:FxSxx-COOH system tetratricopeptide repeat protein n=1 Tax=Umezawaea beigongshangensis TaxID=2780383 RepID=UPI0018F2584D|nr:FxSxx-COOH system tetratricopeptide repeat protein [Umezawaea beigongshangensis]